MRLITHNLLECNIRGVTKGFPLRIEATEREILVSEFDAGISYIQLYFKNILKFYEYIRDYEKYT